MYNTYSINNFASKFIQFLVTCYIFFLGRLSRVVVWRKKILKINTILSDNGHRIVMCSITQVFVREYRAIHTKTQEHSIHQIIFVCSALLAGPTRAGDTITHISGFCSCSPSRWYLEGPRNVVFWNLCDTKRNTSPSDLESCFRQVLLIDLIIYVHVQS